MYEECQTIMLENENFRKSNIEISWITTLVAIIAKLKIETTKYFVTMTSHKSTANILFLFLIFSFTCFSSSAVLDVYECVIKNYFLGYKEVLSWFLFQYSCSVEECEDAKESCLWLDLSRQPQIRSHVFTDLSTHTILIFYYIYFLEVLDSFTWHYTA